MTRTNIDAFGTCRRAEGPPFCRISATATEGSQRNAVLTRTVKLDGVTADVNEITIQCSRQQLYVENLRCKYIHVACVICYYLSLSLSLSLTHTHTHT